MITIKDELSDLMQEEIKNNLNFVRSNIGEASRYEALAEEASELAQASLKVSRILRGENPTPVRLLEGINDLEEEYTDVVLCAEAATVFFDPYVYRDKLHRWKERICSKRGEHES